MVELPCWHSEGTPLTSMVESPSWHSKGGGFSGTSLGRRANGADPSTEQQRKGTDPKNRHSLNEMCFVPGVRLSLWPGWLPRFLFWGALFPGPVLSVVLFLFLLLAAGVTFQLLEGGTSGQTQGHRPKNQYWAPTQGPALSGTPLDVRCSETLAPYIRSIKSAGHMVVCVVTGQMVGDRRSPGATILGVGTIYLLRQPSFPVPPTGCEHLDGSWTVYELAGSVHPDGSYSRICSGTSVRPTRGVAASFGPAVAAAASAQ